jgi:hypothetical protein
MRMREVTTLLSNPSQPVVAIVWRGKLSSGDRFSIGARGYREASYEEEQDKEDDDQA